MSIILKADNISKQYRLGNVGTGTIKDDLKRSWYALRGKEDPFLSRGTLNDRSVRSTDDYVWALQDINFEVNKGDVLGIIGKNGAGKSTLLKILSRVTAPTTGVIKAGGRLASLLEVGTGFHPELTGRENIYLNGAILGMTKAEITSKIDEIIEFSGCQRYIDTPSKRYSSGMKVRLAFAVAAHLEPEILVVDEVLAVGDAEFQKKAIGKMQDISQSGGRTVLFVSHNMASVQDLCNRVITLENGKIVYDGNTREGVNKYLSSNRASIGAVKFEEKSDDSKAYFEKFEILNCHKEARPRFNIGEIITFKIKVRVKSQIRNPIFSLRISDVRNVNIVTWRSNDFKIEPIERKVNRDIEVSLKCKELLLLDDMYTISISFLDGKEILDYKDKFINFEVVPGKPNEDFLSLSKAKSSNSLIYSMAEWNIAYD